MNNTEDERYKKLKIIRDELVLFKKSPLYEYRTNNGFNPVVGEGDHYAHIMFVGEAPGENEAKQGKPFCGASGRILDELLKSITVNRADVYVTNIVKDRPPDNRDPLPAEIDLYAPFLDRQIEIIQPKVIATLGRFSMQYIMNRMGLQLELGPISALHGHVFRAKVSYGKVDILPLYHPAVALYTASKKVEMLKDFQMLKKFL